MGFDVVTGMYGFRCHTVAYPILGSMLHGVACRPCVFFFKWRRELLAVDAVIDDIDLLLRSGLFGELLQAFRKASAEEVRLRTIADGRGGCSDLVSPIRGGLRCRPKNRSRRSEVGRPWRLRAWSQDRPAAARRPPSAQANTRGAAQCERARPLPRTCTGLGVYRAAAKILWYRRGIGIPRVLH